MQIIRLLEIVWCSSLRLLSICLMVFVVVWIAKETDAYASCWTSRLHWGADRFESVTRFGNSGRKNHFEAIDLKAAKVPFKWFQVALHFPVELVLASLNGKVLGARVHFSRHNSPNSCALTDRSGELSGPDP